MIVLLDCIIVGQASLSASPCVPEEEDRLEDGWLSCVEIVSVRGLACVHAWPWTMMERSGRVERFRLGAISMP